MTVREAISRALALLSKRDRRLLGVSVAIQMGTSVLDLIGVLLIGLVGALAVTTIQSEPPPGTVQIVANFLGLGSLTPQGLVVTLAVVAAAVLLFKSIVSSFLTRRVLQFLANRQALVSARLSGELLSRPLAFVQKRSSQETAYALIAGASAATMQVLGFMSIALTEIALLVLLSLALLWVSPGAALGAIVFFGLVALGLQKAIGTWASRVGSAVADADIESMDAIQEALGAYREITVTDRRGMYADRIQALRWRAAALAADTQFIGLFPKYLFEAALVVGGFALAGALFVTQDSVVAVGILALFLAAASRVMPSLLRLQGALLGLRGSAGAAAPTFDLAEDLGMPVHMAEEQPDGQKIKSLLKSGYPEFSPSIRLQSVSVTFPGTRAPALSEVSLEISGGQSVALVGRSGAGKSTLADVILGIIEPSAGLVQLGGQSPSKTLMLWPGGVGYVPQDVLLANGTIRTNVALGLPDDAIDDDMIWNALERAHLAQYLREHRDGLDTRVGEKGVRLSGGQRQRLGIARALYSRPKLLVLDEATSALDAETEESISQMINELEGEVTTFIIAHRLSTIRHVDLLVYLEEGKVIESGSFSDVVRRAPGFERQVALMGLAPSGE